MPTLPPWFESEEALPLSILRLHPSGRGGGRGGDTHRERERREKDAKLEF